MFTPTRAATRTHPLKQALLMATALLAVAHSAWAQEPRREPGGFTWGELSLLPEYCRDVQGVLYNVRGEGKDSPRAPYWVSLMGDSFWHMHHYCYGLRNMLRASAPGLAPRAKRALIERTVGEYEYVIRYSPPTMRLIPEVYLRLAEVHLQLGNLVGAKDAFERSRDLKPDYWPAYVGWVDELIKLKQFDQAKALTVEGLRQAPDTPQLLQRLARLDPKAKPPASAVRANPDATAPAPTGPAGPAGPVGPAMAPAAAMAAPAPATDASDAAKPPAPATATPAPK